MKIRLILLILFIHNVVYGQETLTGTVLDENKSPLIGAYVCQDFSDNCSITDNFGVFQLRMKKDKQNCLTISYLGYKPKKVMISDSVTSPIAIRMELDSTDWFSHSNNYRQRFGSFLLTSGVERINASFNNYDELNQEYVDMFNQIEYLLMLNIAGYYRDFYGAFGYGGSIYPFPKEIDSLQTQTHLQKIHFKFGYGIASNNLNFIFTPYISLDRLRYRLLTKDADDKVSLSKYFDTKYYDVRFIQWIGTLGWDLDVRLFSRRDSYLVNSIYLSIGAGYYIKLGKQPLIESTGNTLTSTGYLDYDNLYLQCSLKLYIYE
jgi:hypothetical protein